MNAKYGSIFLLLGLALLGGCFIVETLPARAGFIYAAGSFLAFGLAYLSQAPGFWLKRTNGTLNPLSFVLFAPLHALNWFSFRLATSLQKPKPFHEIVPGLWLGRRLTGGEAAHFSQLPEAAVLDLTAEFAENKQLRNQNYLCLPTLDHTAPRKEQLEQALQFIQKHIGTRPVFVHCAMGHGRSATVVAAWLLRQNKTQDIRATEKQMKTIRPGVALKRTQVSVLKEFIGK